MQITGCMVDDNNRLVCLHSEVDGEDPGREGFSGNGTGPTPGGGKAVDDSKTFVKIVGLDGNPERDDSSLYGRWDDDGVERNIALTHDEFTAIKAAPGLPYDLEVDSARMREPVTA